MFDYDIIVIGAGHAGCEAALIGARLGLKTAIFTITLDNIGVMSCNPSIGGPAKGHLVKEIDVLGGEMGKNIDKSFLQIRVLNTRKGPAVRALRAQADKQLYHMYMKQTIENTENLFPVQGIVTDLVVENDKIVGVKTKIGVTYKAKAVIVATGTFMKGLIHVGDNKIEGGRMGELSSKSLPDSIEKLGFNLLRFKTGTPPRIDGKTIDYSKLVAQPGEIGPEMKFSHSSNYLDFKDRKQLPCYITHTNVDVHNIILNNLDRTPLYNGSIAGTGPRYCPSIEDKVVRFKERERHHLFLEPEGYTTQEIYVNGISTSLPTDLQIEMLSKINGLENSKIMRFGYAIEYDCIDTKELRFTLESKKIENLYFAGQVNGTSGYEEAAAQGLIAGINAVNKINKKEQFILDRSESYIGTLIDDIITKEIIEPYRMFTSRSEYRLILREDNSDIRLLKYIKKLNLNNENYIKEIELKIENLNKAIKKLEEINLSPKDKNIIEIIERYNEKKLTTGLTAKEFLKRPKVTYNDLKDISEEIPRFDYETEKQIEINVKYEGYIKKQNKMIIKHKQLENNIIPVDFDYDKITSISNESREKLKSTRPVNVGQASRITGVSPADLSVVIMFLEREKFEKRDKTNS